MACGKVVVRTAGEGIVGENVDVTVDAAVVVVVEVVVEVGGGCWLLLAAAVSGGLMDLLSAPVARSVWDRKQDQH